MSTFNFLSVVRPIVVAMAALYILIAAISGSAQEPHVRGPEKTNGPITPARQAMGNQDDGKARRDETIKRLIEGITKLRQQSRTAEAAQRSAELAEQFPGNPAAQAANRISSTVNQLESNRQFQTQRDRSLSGVLGGVEKSSIIPSEDFQYPKDWASRTTQRGNKSQLTAKEKAILRSLDTDISVDFKNTPLNQVVDFLHDRLGQPIVVDDAALKAAEISYDAPITFSVKRISVRTLLRKILADVGLAYAIRDEAIEITTPQRAREANVARVYYIGDLLPFYGRLFAAAQLIELIQSTVEPQSWRANGGSGSIIYNPITKSIVVKQGVEVQSIISESFR
jgi:hypothetical protein